MELMTPALALLVILAIILGGGAIGRDAALEGLVVAAFLIGGCIIFALFMSGHYTAAIRAVTVVVAAVISLFTWAAYESRRSR
jgi:hypothetical protein